MEEGKENGGRGGGDEVKVGIGSAESSPQCHTHSHKLPPGTILKSRTMNMFFGASAESDDGDNVSELMSPTFSISSSSGGGAKRFWSDSSSWILSRIGSSSGSGGSFDKDGRSCRKGKDVEFYDYFLIKFYTHTAQVCKEWAYL